MANHPAYGRNLFSIWKQGFKDRFAGNKARANARWGFVRAPHGTGKVIWVRAGYTRSSVLAAVELLAAIREKRQDVRLVLTFQEDYADILETRLVGLHKTGIGFGPSDLKPAMKRFFSRLEPFAVICVEAPPGENLLQEAKTIGSHVVCVNTKVANGNVNAIETVLPASETGKEQWLKKLKDYQVTEVADMQTLLVDPQVDPNFRSYVSPKSDFKMAWLHHTDPKQWGTLLEAWKNADIAKQGVLFVSLDEMNTYAYQQNPANRDNLLNTLKHKLQGYKVPFLFIDKWQRDYIEPGTVVVVDHHRWLPAIASSVDFIGLYSEAPRVFWQAMGAAAPIAVTEQASPPVNSADLIEWSGSPTDLFEYWSEHAANQFERRRKGDALRRTYWQYRRQADQLKEQLLQQVFDW